jgi:hypothetical protein
LPGAQKIIQASWQAQWAAAWTLTGCFTRRKVRDDSASDFSSSGFLRLIHSPDKNAQSNLQRSERKAIRKRTVE